LRLTIKVVPGSSRTAVVGRFGEGWRIAVSAPPEKGRANAALEILLAEVLALPRADVTVVSGHGQPRKQVEITGLEREEIDARLEAAASRTRAR
jgi:uncharacterized protein (TIGR00251 family)